MRKVIESFQFHWHVRNTSATLPDPGAGETIDSLDGRRVSHNVFDPLEGLLVKLKATYRLRSSTSSRA